MKKKKNCCVSEELMTAYLDNETAKEEKENIEAHLASCPICKEKAEEIKKTILAAKKAAEAAPKISHSEIMAAIEKEKAKKPALSCERLIKRGALPILALLILLLLPPFTERMGKGFDNAGMEMAPDAMLGDAANKGEDDSFFYNSTIENSESMQLPPDKYQTSPDKEDCAATNAPTKEESEATAASGTDTSSAGIYDDCYGELPSSPADAPSEVPPIDKPAYDAAESTDTESDSLTVYILTANTGASLPKGWENDAVCGKDTENGEKRYYITEENVIAAVKALSHKLSVMKKADLFAVFGTELENESGIVLIISPD